MQHPWFNSQTPRNPNGFVPHIPIDFASVLRIKSSLDLDDDILNSLELLGWDHRETLCLALLSPAYVSFNEVGRA